MKTLTKKEEKRQEVEKAKEKLKEYLKNNKNVYTVLNNVSSSGMTRHISVFIAKGKNIINITWWVSKALGYKRNNRTGGLVVGGCGMDMGFHVVYSLSRVLYTKKNNIADSGYILNHQWL